MLSDLAQRVALLLEKLWNGNQRQMASDLGLSPTAIHKVLNGQQEPGGKFLAALARQPKVNATWLMKGDGLPLEDAVPDTSAGAGSLPILDRLLPGPPSKYEAQLLGRMQWVAMVLMRLTRYLFRVSDHAPITRDPAMNVSGGDVLVVETERFWDDDPASLDGRIVAVNVAEMGPPDVRLGLATYVRATDGADDVAVNVKVPGFGELTVAWMKKPGNRGLRGLDFAKPPDFSKGDSPLSAAADRRQTAANEVAERTESVGGGASVSPRPQDYGHHEWRGLIPDDEASPAIGDLAASKTDQLAEAAEREAAEREAATSSTASGARGPKCICGAVLLLNRTY